MDDYIGNFLFFYLLFFISGGMLLKVDAKSYQNQKMKKELKVARSLGWLQLGLGVLAVMIQWMTSLFSS